MNTSFITPITPAVATAENPLFIGVSQLKAWDKCRAQFYFKSLRKQRWLADESNFAFGTQVHALMDMKARDVDLTHIIPQLEAPVSQAFSALCRSEFGQADCLKSEYAFRVPLKTREHVYLTGRLDALLSHNNKVIIVDWKTGTATPKTPEEAWQTKLYLYAVWQLRDALSLNIQSPEALAFAYVESNVKQEKVRSIEVSFSQEALEAIEASLHETVSAMCAETRFNTPSRCPDAYCPFSSVCGIQEAPSTQLSLFALPQRDLLQEASTKEEHSAFDLF